MLHTKTTILLTSNGLNPKLIKPELEEAPEIKEAFLSSLRKKPSETSVAFITTAAYGKIDWSETKTANFLESERRQLREVGITDIKNIDLRRLKNEKLERELRNRDVILIGAGDSFFLLKHARESGFDKMLPKLVEQGKIVVGISAGSYILGPNIRQATWKQHKDTNWVGLTEEQIDRGLNQVEFLVTAHFEEKYRELVIEGAKRAGYPVVAISDVQAVMVRGDKVKVVGKGNREFFNGFAENR